jgi:hypothetical protein
MVFIVFHKHRFTSAALASKGDKLFEKKSTSCAAEHKKQKSQSPLSLQVAPNIRTTDWNAFWLCQFVPVKKPLR